VPCSHQHLKFSDGSFLLSCIDCGQSWAGIDAAGAPAMALKSVPMWAPHDTRHDRWVVSRTEPPLKVTPLKKIP
jgi:hypothetical protein